MWKETTPSFFSCEDQRGVVVEVDFGPFFFFFPEETAFF